MVSSAPASRSGPREDGDTPVRQRTTVADAAALEVVDLPIWVKTEARAVLADRSERTMAR